MKIAELLVSARKSVLQTVNQTMVLTYFEIGRMIVEDEQNGEQRAAYGKSVLKQLSVQFTSGFGKGFSVENLDRMRFFYKTYVNQNSSTVLTNFNLSWSHYLKLMRIDNENERKFYEVEAFTNNWSLREFY